MPVNTNSFRLSVKPLPNCTLDILMLQSFVHLPLDLPPSVCSTSKAHFRDWATAHQKYGATSFITVPLEVGAGVMGSLTAAGGPKMDNKAVQALAGRLAEVLLRRTTESLLKVGNSKLTVHGALQLRKCYFGTGTLFVCWLACS